MKKFLLIIISTTLLACGSNEGGDASGTATEQANNAAQLDGRQLIRKSDCSACHLDDDKLIGPGYKQVAERYTANDSTISYLATKIIEGGSGNWGQQPMTPHPQHSQAEAEAMARYILSLND